jgi:hypothetical protein
MATQSVGDRFWCKVAKGDGCWLWTAAKLKTGYGGFQLGTWGNSRVVRAHRMAWELTRGPIPRGLCVLHKCDVRLCVNPDHLFLGTKGDNVADMRAKGRANDTDGRYKGSEHHNAKLTEDDVRKIRRRYAEFSGYGACQALARDFGVSRRAIYQIVRGLVWTHVA